MTVFTGSYEGKKKENRGYRCATTNRNRRVAYSPARSFVRNFSVLCSRLCMHNELQSRNSLLKLKPSDFTTVGNNQLTIISAYVRKDGKNDACFFDFDRCVAIGNVSLEIEYSIQISISTRTVYIKLRFVRECLFLNFETVPLSIRKYVNF